MDAPQGNKIQQALRWVASELAERQDVKRWQLLQEAAQRYDLDPRETELLIQMKPDSSPEAT